LALDNTDPIQDGAVLYTCNVTVSGSGGTVAVSGVHMSTPAGSAISSPGSQDGIICVGGSTPPSPTPTQGTAACPEPRPAPTGPALWGDDQNLPAGTTSGTFSVKLVTGDNQVAGTQNDLTFPAGLQIDTVSGKPACSVNPAIDKGGTAFSFRPSGCTPGVDCMVRALVLALDNTDPIPDGSVLYTCAVKNITTGGEITLSGLHMSTPAGSALTGVGGQGINFCVEGVVQPTLTPTNPPPPPSATPTLTVAPPSPPTATNTPKPTSTASPTSTPNTSGTVVEDEGGCQINTLGTSSSGWLLLFPVAAILVIRRRSR